MTLQYEFLADRANAIPVVSEWYFDEWGHLLGDETVADSRERVEHYLNRDRVPFILVATENDELVAAAQLKFHELEEQFPELKYWVGGVIVPPEHRGQGHASRIVERIASMAPAWGIETLHLQTERLDGGLYARLGWTPIIPAVNKGRDVVVMKRRL